MKILLVTDQFYDANNGLTISSRRFAKVLESHGHQVRVVCARASESSESRECDYPLQKQYIPIFDHLVTSQGMTFAKPDDDILEVAIQWADVVHFISPFILSHHGIMICRKLGKPYTSAFHVQPENITSSIHMGSWNWLSHLIYLGFNRYIYQYCAHVHCPSNFIANELKKAGYTSCLHVISNGIDPDFSYRKLEKSPELSGKFVILMVGRLSREKRQDVLIRAIAKSKYADRIQLVLAGKGPKAEQLRALSDSLLPIPAKIGFFSKPDLLDLIAMSDLYVHAADAEIEAMSCMEAFACGLVPIIANSTKSATPQFALDERSLFPAGDYAALADKIDYWVTHEKERKQMELQYAALGKKYDLDQCVSQAEDMFLQAIRETREQPRFSDEMLAQRA